MINSSWTLPTFLENPKRSAIYSLIEISPWYSSQFIEKCAIVRWFDKETLVNFVGMHDQDENIQRFLGSIIVEKRNYGSALHDMIRDRICNQILFRDPERFHTLQLDAANYYRSRINLSSGSINQLFNIEFMYHLIRASQDEAFLFLERLLSRDQIVENHDFFLALLETTKGVRLKDQYARKIEQWKITFSNRYE